MNVKNKLIFTNGCFDVIHRGHIELLWYCASLGEVIIGLNSDNSVKRLKGEGRPINSEIDRKYILESLKCVSKVMIFEEDIAAKFCILIKEKNVRSTTIN